MTGNRGGPPLQWNLTAECDESILPPRKTAAVDFEPPGPGTCRVICDEFLYRTFGMEGALIVDGK